MSALPHALHSPPVAAVHRPRLVFLHGIGGRAKGWEPVMRRAHARGWASLAWDQPGYGDSPAPATWSFEAWSDALHGLLQSLGGAPVVLVGHSLGGMVALQHAAQHPGDVAALVLAASSPAFGHADGAFQQQFVAQRLAPLRAGQSMRELAQTLMPSLAAPGPTRPGLALAQACMGSLTPEAYENALKVLVTFEQRAALPHLQVPCLCLAAEHDRTAPPAVVERMAQRIPASTYRCLPQLGHLLCFEDPQGFADAVIDFLEPVFP